MESEFRSDSTLSSSVKLGVYTLPNRIVMAPMSCLSARYNLSISGIVDYYATKASAGLIVTDPTLISPLEGFDNCPGIYTRQQIEKWREITEAVRDRGGKIFLQLWYCEDKSSFCQLGESLHINGLAIDKDLYAVVRLFRRAAQNALAADFDGVEIHAAFGYMDEHDFKPSLRFSHDFQQQIELLTRIIEEVASVWDEDRVGIRITPEFTLFNPKESNLLNYIHNLFDAFNFYDVAYVHLVQSANIQGVDRQVFSVLTSMLRSIYHGVMISSCQNDLRKGREAIAEGTADLISFNSSVAC